MRRVNKRLQSCIASSRNLREKASKARAAANSQESVDKSGKSRAGAKAADRALDLMAPWNHSMERMRGRHETTEAAESSSNVDADK